VARALELGDAFSYGIVERAVSVIHAALQLGNVGAISPLAGSLEKPSLIMLPSPEAIWTKPQAE
jgi:hypothetical protein